MLIDHENQPTAIPPYPPQDNKTGPWHNNPHNPAEAHWIIKCDDFVGSDQYIDHSKAYRKTTYWLQERLYFSTEFSLLIEYGTTHPEALLTIRPCNNTKAFRKRNKLAHYFSYRTLAFEARRNRVKGAEERIAKEIIEPIYRRLFHLERDERPSHLILGYDDDNDILSAIASEEGDQKLYAKYCRAKGLIA